jgi:hypothetical protein
MPYHHFGEMFSREVSGLTTYNLHVLSILKSAVRFK